MVFSESGSAPPLAKAVGDRCHVDPRGFFIVTCGVGADE